MDRERRLELRSLLTRAEAAAPVGVVDAMAAALLEMLDAREVSFLIADFSGRSLNRLGHTAASEELGSRSEETSERVALEGTPYGAALARQRSVLLSEGADTRVLAPVTSRGEAVGVLELVLPFEPAAITLEDVELAAHQLAYMVIANRRYTDLFEWGQRTVAGVARRADGPRAERRTPTAVPPSPGSSPRNRSPRGGTAGRVAGRELERAGTAA